MERGTGSSCPQQLQHPALFQPLPYLLQRMIAIQNREHQGLDPTPTREHMRRMGRDEAIDHGRDLQTS